MNNYSAGILVSRPEFLALAHGSGIFPVLPTPVPAGSRADGRLGGVPGGSGAADGLAVF